MLPVKKVFTDKTGTGNSIIFNAQWYPKVTAQVTRTGGTAHNVKLQGKIHKDAAWEDVDAGGANVTILKSSTDWYHLFRIVIVSSDGTINAWIGAGGA